MIDKQMGEMVDMLEDNGEIRFTGYDNEVFIQSSDNKDGYSYVSSTNMEFDSSREAVEWAVDQFGGIENIDEWE